MVVVVLVAVVPVAAAALAASLPKDVRVISLTNTTSSTHSINRNINTAMLACGCAPAIAGCVKPLGPPIAGGGSTRVVSVCTINRDRTIVAAG